MITLKVDAKRFEALMEELREKLKHYEGQELTPSLRNSIRGQVEACLWKRLAQPEIVEVCSRCSHEPTHPDHVKYCPNYEKPERPSKELEDSPCCKCGLPENHRRHNTSLITAHAFKAWRECLECRAAFPPHSECPNHGA